MEPDPARQLPSEFYCSGTQFQAKAQDVASACDLHGWHKVSSLERRLTRKRFKPERFVPPLSFGYNLTYQAYPGLKTLISLAALRVGTHLWITPGKRKSECVKKVQPKIHQRQPKEIIKSFKMMAAKAKCDTSCAQVLKASVCKCQVQLCTFRHVSIDTHPWAHRHDLFDKHLQPSPNENWCMQGEVPHCWRQK